MKRLILVMGVTFAVTLAVVITNRLSDEALALIAGIVLGALAGIPTSLMAILAFQRSRREPAGTQPNGLPHGGSPQPPIFIVTGAGAQPALPPAYPSPGPASALALRGERTFTIIGEEATEQ